MYARLTAATAPTPPNELINQPTWRRWPLTAIWLSGCEKLPSYCRWPWMSCCRRRNRLVWVLLLHDMQPVLSCPCFLLASLCAEWIHWYTVPSERPPCLLTAPRPRVKCDRVCAHALCGMRRLRSRKSRLCQMCLKSKNPPAPPEKNK